jgi:hypothetical protein
MAGQITPGPWIITPDAKLPFDLQVHTQQGVAIAKVYGRDATRNDTDTKAITAVPDMIAALLPFAQCVDQIAVTEDGEEWAKFRLLIKDYRAAAEALRKAGVL